MSVSRNELYSLGLDDHDRLNKELGGGIPPGSIVLVEGDYGAGKSAMSQRFSYGLCEEGHDVTYLSTELTVGSFLDQMHSLSYDAVDHLLNEDLLFLHADVSDGNTFSGGGKDEDRKQLLKRLMEAELMWEADVIIIDTFDAILRNDPKFEALVRQNDERQAASASCSPSTRRRSTRRPSGRFARSPTCSSNSRWSRSGTTRAGRSACYGSPGWANRSGTRSATRSVRAPASSSNHGVSHDD